jgi:penicillin-binding protein 1A
VVGVWVGRDDNKSLGKITGGTAPAEIWRRFMGPAIAIDGRRGPPLPAGFRVPERQPERRERKSPLPDDWSEGGEAIRSILEMVERLIDEN